jgi:hypothetical protein
MLQIKIEGQANLKKGGFTPLAFLCCLHVSV